MPARQYLLCTAKTAQCPVRIIGALEYKKNERKKTKYRQGTLNLAPNAGKGAHFTLGKGIKFCSKTKSLFVCSALLLMGVLEWFCVDCHSIQFRSYQSQTKILEMLKIVFLQEGIELSRLRVRNIFLWILAWFGVDCIQLHSENVCWSQAELIDLEYILRRPQNLKKSPSQF